MQKSTGNVYAPALLNHNYFR
uniref:Uncharacterized protein n=1 Tax=Anguilla anguilla TaxID=7936 RepID=A0A0E9TVS6_ANGAN